MKNTLKTIQNAIITGIGIGMPVTIICMILIGGFNPIIKEFLVWLIASALFGVASVVSFQLLSKANLLLSTVIHCVCCFGITIAAAAIIGYSSNILSLITAIGPVFIVVYAVIYFCHFFVGRKNAKQVNEQLSKK